MTAAIRVDLRRMVSGAGNADKSENEGCNGDNRFHA
jgi:hypothetical protein